MAYKEVEKPEVIKELEKNPVVQVAIQNINISRATFYRWINEDENFKNECRESQRKGVQLINDLAESKVIKGVEEGDVNMIRFWLNNRHYAFSFRENTRVKDILGNDSDA